MGSPSLTHSPHPHDPRGPPEFTYHRSQVVQQCERGDEVCGVLQPGVAMATEPEHPTGELRQSGEQTEGTAAALCPYILPCRAHLQPEPGPPGSS